MDKQKLNNLGAQIQPVFEKGGLHAAVEFLDDCIKKSPNFIEAYLMRGTLYSEKGGDFQKALNDFTKAIAIDPNEPESYTTRGLLYVKSGGDINKALADFNKTIELDANYASAYVNRANVYLKMSELHKAISDCTKAIEISPDESMAYYNRGLAYVNIGEHAKALEDYNKVIQLAPENAEAYANRGFIHSQLGNVQEAIRDLEKFLEFDTNNQKAAEARVLLTALRKGKIPSTGSASRYQEPERKGNSSGSDKSGRPRKLIVMGIGLVIGCVIGGVIGHNVFYNRFSGLLIGAIWGIGIGPIGTAFKKDVGEYWRDAWEDINDAFGEGFGNLGRVFLWKFIVFLFWRFAIKLYLKCLISPIIAIWQLITDDTIEGAWFCFW